jgi:hypothetical protein
MRFDPFGEGDMENVRAEILAQCGPIMYFFYLFCLDSRVQCRVLGRDFHRLIKLGFSTTG